jgi:hypothetical protein
MGRLVMASRMLALRGPDAGANRQTDAIARVVDETAQQVQATPIGGAAPPAWVRPQLLNGFVDTALMAAPAAYHVDALRYVHLCGAVDTAAGCAAGTEVFRLPAGARPASPRTCAVVRVSAGTFAIVSIETSGAVVTVQALLAGATLGLDGVDFLAEG